VNKEDMLNKEDITEYSLISRFSIELRIASTAVVTGGSASEMAKEAGIRGRG